MRPVSSIRRRSTRPCRPRASKGINGSRISWFFGVRALPRRACTPIWRRRRAIHRQHTVTWPIFFKGRAPGGSQLVTHGEWMGGRRLPEASSRIGGDSGRTGNYRPAPPLPAARSAYFRSIGNRMIGMWLMLHQCPRGVRARIARRHGVRGPAPTEILGADDGLG